ncbi:MAG: hypothetical protein K2H64_07135 [Desulfovibrio sp.]|nr:hypothetical protein [Desulfovibrio sp.]
MLQEHDISFPGRKPEELEDRLARQKPLYPPDTPGFLAGSNTFAPPFRMFEEYLKIINKYIPGHGRLSIRVRLSGMAP